MSDLGTCQSCHRAFGDDPSINCFSRDAKGCYQEQLRQRDATIERLKGEAALLRDASIESARVMATRIALLDVVAARALNVHKQLSDNGYARAWARRELEKALEAAGLGP